MSKLELLTGRGYLSYSAMSSYLECGNRFALERVYNAPQTPAWWFLAGDAFHKATEDFDHADEFEPDQAEAHWHARWAEAMAEVEDPKALKAGGRKSAQWPDKENGDYWTATGPSLMRLYAKWKQDVFEEGWQWLALPDGKPAIEVPVQFEAEDVLVKGYIDRVMVDPNGQVVVMDLKTGSREPASSLQLGVYALGLQRNLDIAATLGGYYMARKGEIPTLHSLTHLTNEIPGWFSSTKKAIEHEIFIPKVGPLCGSCSVAPYCTAVGGDPTLLAPHCNVAQDSNNTPTQEVAK